MTTPLRREDFLVSVAMAGIGSLGVAVLGRLAEQLATHFRFWEIVIATGGENDDLKAAVQTIPNIRVLRVDDVDSYYRMRMIAAAEAIGDVVVITTSEEIGSLDITALAKDVYASNEVIVFSRASQPTFASLMDGLGAVAGYRIDLRDTLTAGFPRKWLSVVLGRPDAELLLRFEARRGGLPRFQRRSVPPGAKLSRELKSTGRRLRLLADIMADSAPRVLRGIAVLAFLMTGLAVAYAAYAILVWLFLEHVAPGWLTTSLLQSLIAFFLGLAVSAMSMGIVKLFERLDGVLGYTVIDEVSNVDFFSEVKDLNVDITKA